MARANEDEAREAAAPPGDVERLLRAIASDATLPPYIKPADAAVATACALFDRLTPGQGHHLLAALPRELQTLFARCYAERGAHSVAHISRAELVDRVAWELGVAPSSAELVSAAVFHALASILPAEESAHVAQQLPRDLQELWRVIPATAEDIAGDLDLLRQLVDDIERSETLPTRLTARDAFSSVMCLFTQHLSGGEARELFLGLPRTVRPLVDRCILERREPPLTFGVDELVANVALDVGMDLEEARALVTAVLSAVTRILPRKVLDHVASQLPEDLRTLWSA
jgi:uncharacterized protein (DUF2267 family)